MPVFIAFQRQKQIQSVIAIDQLSPKAYKPHAVLYIHYGIHSLLTTYADISMEKYVHLTAEYVKQQGT